MTLARALSFALVAAASALPAKAQPPPRLAGAGSAQPSMSKAMREKAKHEMSQMDDQMKAMKDMHEKITQSMMTMMVDRMPAAPMK